MLFGKDYLTTELKKIGIQVLPSESNTLMSQKKWPNSFFKMLFDNKIAVAIIEEDSPNHFFRIAIQDHRTNTIFIQKLKKLNIKEFK